MGYYAVYIIQHIQVEKEMKAFIKSETGLKNLQQLILTADQYAAVCFIEEDEFIYDEQLYDMILKESSGNRIILYCYSDEKEEQLINTAKHFFNQGNNASKSSDEQTDFLELIIKDSDFLSTTYEFQSIQSNVFFRPYSDTYNDLSPTPHFPPPRIIS